MGPLCGLRLAQNASLTLNNNNIDSFFLFYRLIMYTICRWGSQPHGSAWVKRQALHFLREEFQTITGSPVLFQLDKPFFIEALQSPFLQASELEVLQGVLKWAEHRLIRRMEDRGE